MFKYYNANPLKRNVNDCSVRAVAKATEREWNEVYKELSDLARVRAITFTEIDFIDWYLKENFIAYCLPKNVYTLENFLELKLKGNYIITMSGHVTCVIDGVCYDTFYPKDKFIWCVYKVR